jgi:hypothetical protein
MKIFGRIELRCKFGENSPKLFNCSRMKNRFLYLLPLAMGLSLTACKKDSETTPAPTKSELLTAKNWRVSAAVTTTKVGTAATTTVDDYAGSPACEKDDFIKFEANKTLVANGGTVLCPGDPQTASGAWDFNSDQTKLTLGVGSTGLVGQYDLAELSATTLKISTTDTSTPGTVETSTITFTSF